MTHLLKPASIAALVLLSQVVNAQQYSKVTYIHSDPEGTPFAATDAQGNIEWQIDHFPYGNEYENTEVARKSDISFAGKPYDEEIGLSYFGARWYDPDIGRFTGIDPMPVDPEDFRTYNRYVYGFNNPYKFVDPDGREAEIIHGKTGGITINIPINFSGPAANPSVINSIKSDIASRWSGSHNINGKQTQVDVRVTAPVAGGLNNSVKLLNGPTSLKSCQGCSFVSGFRNNRGEWNMTGIGMKLGEAAHEAGHLMGAIDRYKITFDASGNRVTTPMVGFKGNIMAETPGTPNAANFQKILKSKRNKTKRTK